MPATTKINMQIKSDLSTMCKSTDGLIYVWRNGACEGHVCAFTSPYHVPDNVLRPISNMLDIRAMSTKSVAFNFYYPRSGDMCNGPEMKFKLSFSGGFPSEILATVQRARCASYGLCTRGISKGYIDRFTSKPISSVDASRMQCISLYYLKSKS